MQASKIIVFIGFLLFSQTVLAQLSQKGEVYLFWGYNQTIYGRSDIHFTGQGMDFMLRQVYAQDRPDAFAVDPYFQISKLTIPQFNFRVGYYLTDRWAVSIGWDHMKYVMANNQAVHIEGVITEEALDEISKNNETSKQYIGTYDGVTMPIPEDFMRFEHTDGLNNVRASVEYYMPLVATANNRYGLELMNGIGLGVMMPWTDFTFLRGQRHQNRPHLSGITFTYHAAPRITLFRYGFLQPEVTAGWTTMPWIKPISGTDARAQQHFGFASFSITGGAKFPIFKKKTTAK